MNDATAPKPGWSHDLLHRVSFPRLGLRVIFLSLIVFFIDFLPALSDAPLRPDVFTFLTLPFWSLKVLAVHLLGASWVAVEIRTYMESGELGERLGRGESDWKMLWDVLRVAVIPFLIAAAVWLLGWFAFRAPFPGVLRGWSRLGLDATDWRWISWGRWFAVPAAAFAWVGLHSMGLCLGALVALRHRRPRLVIPAGGAIVLLVGIWFLCLAAMINVMINDISRLAMDPAYLAKAAKCITVGLVVACLAMVVVVRAMLARCYYNAFIYALALYCSVDFMLTSGCNPDSPMTQLFGWKVLYPCLFRRAVIYYGIMDALILCGIAGMMTWLNLRKRGRAAAL